MYAHKHPEPTDPRVGPAIVYLIVGLPGARKATRAKELEISASSLRLTPDEWQIALFGDQTHQIGVTSLRASWFRRRGTPRPRTRWS
jgi:hypothetical protein